MSDFLNCPNCGFATATVLGVKGPSRFVECLSCELIRIDPLPTSEQFQAHYTDYGLEERLPKARGRVWRYRFKLVPLLMMAKGKKFLDIGCHLGSMVEAARQNGCDAHGIELSTGVVKEARKMFPGCKFFNETIEEFAKRGLKFDVIHCSEVIEHIPNLDSFMTALCAICEEEAVLLFSTPDSGHFSVRKDRILEWSELRPVGHVSIFNRKNIRSLFLRFGLSPVFFYPALRANQRFIARRNVPAL